MNFTLLCLIAILIYIYFWFQNRKNYWKNLGFDYVKLDFPYGSFKGIGTEKALCDGLDEFYREFKGKAKVVGLFNFVKPVLLPIDPDVIKYILIQNFDNFHDRYVYYNQRDDPLSVHLLALQGNEWRDRRAKLTPTFTSGKLKLVFDTIQNISNQLVVTLEKSIKSSAQTEMHEINARYTTDVISNVAFGLDSNCLNNPDSDMRKYGKDITDFKPYDFLKFQFTCSFPELSRKLHLTANKPNVIDFFYKTFRKNIEQRERTQSFRKDFLQILLELKKSSTLTVDELAAESFLFFVGGFETSSSLISFTLYELALNLDIQSRVRDEINQAVEENDGKITYDLINRLDYLEMVTNESLRKYPPAYFLSRVCTKDFQIPETDLVIPKGTHININVYSLHCDPEYYPEPQRFDPERFSSENIKMRPQCSYIPFGDGPRRCIGGRFAMMQSKMGLAKLILNFEFTPCEKTVIPMRFAPTSLFLESVDKIWLNVRKI